MRDVIAYTIAFCLLMGALFWMQGCATLDIGKYQPPQECISEDGSMKDSIILKYVDYPRETALVLKLANLEAVKHTDLSKQDVQEFLKRMLDFLEGEVTYAKFYQRVGAAIGLVNSYIDEEIMLLSQYANSIGQKKLPITACDKALLRKHLKEQMAVISTVQE